MTTASSPGAVEGATFAQGGVRDSSGVLLKAIVTSATGLPVD